MSLKGNKLYILLFVLLTALTFFVLNRNKFSTLKSELRNFAIADTAVIDKIFLADKQGFSITLERVNVGEWKVNNKYKASQPKINTLLETMKLLEVKFPVPEKDFNSVVADMATRSVKVEIYQKGELAKTYYVGIQTVDQLGTYMLMENSKSPFITHIPGFNGYLNTRYFTKEKEWKTKAIFEERAADIDYVKVEYPMEPQKSFVVSADGSVVPLSEKTEPLQNINKQLVQFYLASFEQLNYEGYDQAFNQQRADSVAALTSYCIVELKNKKGKVTKLRLFLKAVDGQTMQQFDEKTNQPLEFDPERYYALLDEEKDLLLVQHFVVGKVLRSYADFFAPLP